MLGKLTEVVDPYLAIFEHMGGQALQPHQKTLIDAAAALVANVPKGAWNA